MDNLRGKSMASENSHFAELLEEILQICMCCPEFAYTNTIILFNLGE